jgi:hypothetical protein
VWRRAAGCRFGRAQLASPFRLKAQGPTDDFTAKEFSLGIKTKQHGLTVVTNGCGVVADQQQTLMFF